MCFLSYLFPSLLAGSLLEYFCNRQGLFGWLVDHLFKITLFTLSVAADAIVMLLDFGPYGISVSLCVYCFRFYNSCRVIC
jgi:hypothetical protein